MKVMSEIVWLQISCWTRCRHPRPCGSAGENGEWSKRYQGENWRRSREVEYYYVNLIHSPTCSYPYFLVLITNSPMFPIAGSCLLTRNRVSKFGRCFIRSREIFSHQLRSQSKRWSICLKLWQKEESEKYLPHKQKYLTTKTKNIQTPVCLAPQVGRGKLRGGSRVKTSTSASAQPLRCFTGKFHFSSSELCFHRLM